MILLAILLPWLSFLIRGKILAGILCLILQCTLIGWLPAAIWAVMSRNQEVTNDKLNEIQKSISSNRSSNTTFGKSEFDVLSDQSHRFYEQKDYSSAIGILQRMIEVNPKENKTYFNLACCYSLTHNKEGFNALSNAVSHGYNNFERIKIYKALTWLREQPEFDQFLKNGYKLYVDTKKVVKPNVDSNDDMYAKIEKLGKLKEQGFISEEEFQEQKNKILV